MKKLRQVYYKYNDVYVYVYKYAAYMGPGVCMQYGGSSSPHILTNLPKLELLRNFWGPKTKVRCSP